VRQPSGRRAIVSPVHAFVDLRLPDGSLRRAGPGGVLGRSFSADVRFIDGRISEAHAMVSLRGSELVLFALRGRLRVAERDVPKVTLSPGLVITLAPGVDVVVAALQVPEAVLAVEGGAVPRQVLLGVTSILRGPPLHLGAGVHADAAALVFSDGLDWFARVTGEAAARPVKAGDVLDVAGVALRFVEVETGAAAVADTVPMPLSGHTRLRVVSHFETIQIWRDDDGSPITFAGVAARVLAELLAFGGPTRWELVARAVWGDDDPGVLRHRLDVTLQKIRRRLDESGIRRDLVRAWRDGHLELFLHPGDQADDRG
jgi:hypothetical protein